MTETTQIGTDIAGEEQPTESRRKRSRQPTLPDHQLTFWEKTFQNTEKFMVQHHRLWRELLAMYRLEFDADMLGLPEEQQKHISRFYPLTRQIIASTVFQDPRIAIRTEDAPVAFQAEILERYANDVIRSIGAKEQVQQMEFDALYCFLGVVKCGINPPGDDAVPPYVTNDEMQDGMFYVQRVSPFNYFKDITASAHATKRGRFRYEKMLTPIEFVMKDERFSRKGDIKPINKEDAESMLQDWEEDPNRDEDEGAMLTAVYEDGNYTMLREVHDRIHKRLITFAHGVKQPIELRPHPFLAGETKMQQDPLTGEMKATKDFKPTGGYLVVGGTPYLELTLDMVDDRPYGKPMMAYAKDTQLGIVDSVSRRAQAVKRNARIILGQRGEQKENPDVGKDVEEGKDGTIVWVNDVNNSFAEMTQSTPATDQLGLESDYRNYEEQVLGVSQMLQGGSGRVTATQAALSASFGQLNRDWMQDQIAKVYEDMTHNLLRLSGDVRYLPRNYLVNVAETDAAPTFEAITQDLLKVRYKVHIEAGSMKPMFEEFEREDALALGKMMLQLPEIPRTEAIKHMLRAFRVPNVEKFIGPAAGFDAKRAASYENSLLMAGQAVQPMPNDSHRLHIETHQKVAQSPEWQQLQQGNPVAAQLVGQQIQAHIQQHAQLLQQQAGGNAGGDVSREDIGAMSDQGGLDTVRGQIGKVDSAVRSSAQDISQTAASIDRNQN